MSNLSHWEMAARIADDIASGPDTEYTLPYLVAGMIHGMLAVVEELEALGNTMAEGQGT